MSEPTSESTPLLPKRQGGNSEAPKWRDVAICALAYCVAALFVFTPLRQFLGKSSNKHIVATTSVWFHPVRPLGNLIEVIYFTVMLLLFSISVSAAITLLVQELFTHSIPIWAEDMTLLLFLAGSLGLVGFMKVRANNPSFNTASSAAIIFLVTTLLKDDDVQRGAMSFDRVLNYLKMVALGATISSTVSAVFYRRSSVDVFRKKADDLMERYADLLDLLVYQFGRGTGNASIADEYESVNNEANSLLSALKNQLQYAKYEFALFAWRSKSKAQLKMLQGTQWSLQRQSMHLGGLLHCIGVADLLLDQASTSSSQTLSRRNSSRWDSVGRSAIAASLKAAKKTSPLRNFHEVFGRLQRPVQSFAEQLADFLRSVNTREDVSAMRTRLATYTHARDMELRDHSDQAASEATPIEDGLLATCSLFAHILQDLGEEILLAEGLRLDFEDAEALAREGNLVQLAVEKEEPFTQLTEALYPTRRAPHAGVGPSIWKIITFLRNLDVQHGIRVGVGAAIISLPAFTSDYRETFRLWHGEWAVITYMIIMARNLGSMTHNIPLRIIGTTVGALAGVVASISCGENPALLLLCALIMALLCFRRILSNHDAVLGRFILLTFNLVCLYGYLVSQNDRDEDDPVLGSPIYDIAFHRVISVLTGVLWAVFMTVTFWPHSARRALRSDLCIQWMRMGMTWKRDPIGIVRRTDSPSARFRGVHNERELQNMMLDLEALLKTAPNEFRLRGKFDPEPYKHLLEATQVILDAFHSISVLINDEPTASPRELDLVADTSAERQELCNLLFLQFYTASASIRLGFPVPEYLPQPESATERLVKKLKERRWAFQHEPAARGSVTEQHDAAAISDENYDFVLFHSYLMTAITISGELRRIHNALRLMFGTLDDELLFSYV